MAEKPTYAELEQTVKKLENEAVKRERMEKALDTQMRELISIFDSINERIYICDPDTHEVLYVNAATTAIFGPDLVGRKCYRVFQGSDEPCDFCTNPMIFGENLGDFYIWEFQNRLNGRWYRRIVKAIRWPDGRMVRYEMAIDINDMKVAQEALRESEEKYRKLVENANEGILVVQDGQLKFANSCASELTDYSEEELLSRPLIEFVHPDDREVV